MEPKLRGIDILGLLFGTIGLVESAVGLVLQPGYRALFLEFTGGVPPLTRLMLEPATLIVTGLVPLAFVAEGVLRRRSERQLIARTVVALVSALALVAVFALAMWLPLAKVAEDVK